MKRPPRNLSAGKQREHKLYVETIEESFYRGFLTTPTLDTPNIRNRLHRRNMTEVPEPRLREVWPRVTKCRKQCFGLLRAAHVKARQLRDARITNEQLAWLAECIEGLREIAQGVPKARRTGMRMAFSAA